MKNNDIPVRRDKYGQTIKEFTKKFMEDYKLSGKAGKAIAESVAFAIDSNREEARPIAVKYLKEFLCPWDGGLHHDERCDKKTREYIDVNKEAPMIWRDFDAA